MFEDVHREDLVDRAVRDREPVGEVRDHVHRRARPAIQPDIAGVLQGVPAPDVEDDRISTRDPYAIPHRVHPGEPANRLADLLQLLRVVHVPGQMGHTAVEADLDRQATQPRVVGQQVARGRGQPSVVPALTVRGEWLGAIHAADYPPAAGRKPPRSVSAYPGPAPRPARVSWAGAGNFRAMSGKHKEGTNRGRRALARDAREAGLRPSEAGVTLGASKQRESLTRSRRAGPPPAGRHKPAYARPPERREPERPWPMPDGPNVPVAGAPVVRYRDLVAAVGRRTGLDFDQARRAAEATIVTLARTLDQEERERFLGVIPRELRDSYPLTAGERPSDLATFLREVGRLAQRTPEQARYSCQAVIHALVEQNPAVLDGLHLPDGFDELAAPFEPGGGLVATDGHTAPLTAQELRSALAELPYWTPTSNGLLREITLPAANLERVLRRLTALRDETGRAPHIGRVTPDTARLVVRTNEAGGAVTALDVELAHQVDAAIQEVGAGIAS